MLSAILVNDVLLLRSNAIIFFTAKTCSLGAEHSVPETILIVLVQGNFHSGLPTSSESLFYNPVTKPETL